MEVGGKEMKYIETEPGKVNVKVCMHDWMPYSWYQNGTEYILDRVVCKLCFKIDFIEELIDKD